MPDTNMDVRKNPNATSPVFEFTLPNSEVDLELSVGEKGELIIPVECVAKTDDSKTYRKIGSTRAEKPFQKETAKDMRSRIGVVKNLEGKDED